MTGLLRELLEILRLGAAVPFTKRMNVVDVANDDAGLASELVRRQPLQEFGPGQAAMNVGHAGRNVLTELELIPALEYFDRPKLTRPVVEVLK